MNEPITWNRERLQSLERAWKKASEEKLEQFEWQGYTFVTNYAKYLLEYMEPMFRKKGQR